MLKRLVEEASTDSDQSRRLKSAIAEACGFETVCFIWSSFFGDLQDLSDSILQPNGFLVQKSSGQDISTDSTMRSFMLGGNVDSHFTIES